MEEERKTGRKTDTQKERQNERKRVTDGEK